MTGRLLLQFLQEKPMIRLFLLAFLAFLALGAMLVFQPAALAARFDGVTIIEFADEAGWNAIRGRPAMGPAQSGTYIVTFVSGMGSYAALLGGFGSGRLCVAWAVETSYTGQSITFGLPASVASMEATPEICQPFTLTYEDAETIRIDARNKFARSGGPLSEAADMVSYGGAHRIVARVPLVPLDWGQRIFDTHTIKGVRLGPLPAVEAALSGQRVTISVSDMKRQMIYRKGFEAVVEDQSGASEQVRVGGYVAAKEVLGWPWDVVYGAWLQEGIAETTREAFEGAVSERYGTQSLRYLNDAGQFQLLWIYDLAGRQLTANSDEPDPTGRRFLADAATPDNCLAVGADQWLGKQGFADIVNRDIGPWGCPLIMTLTYDGRRGVVDSYRIEMVSGYALALNHFFTRLE
jgi:hypothetical protein